MRFITWLRDQKKRKDHVGEFAVWATRNKKFPLSSDPAFSKIFIIGNKIAPELYTGYVMAFVEYSITEGNQIPKYYKSFDDLKSMLLK